LIARQDREISFNFVGVVRSVLDLITAFSVILAVLPAFMLWIAPMLWLYYKVQKIYRKTAREIKRLSSNARSPIFAHCELLTGCSPRVAHWLLTGCTLVCMLTVNETINGLITMRAFGETERFQDKCGANVDYFTRCVLLVLVVPDPPTISSLSGYHGIAPQGYNVPSDDRPLAVRPAAGARSNHALLDLAGRHGVPRRAGRRTRRTRHELLDAGSDHPKPKSRQACF
jgi:hypothetical protein